MEKNKDTPFLRSGVSHFKDNGHMEELHSVAQKQQWRAPAEIFDYGYLSTYWWSNTANHATFPIQIRKITVQICGNFWVTQ